MREPRDRPTPPTTVPDRQPAPSAPPRHSRYRVGELLGEGGQGLVYLAHDLELDRDVALKTIRTAAVSHAKVATFLDEAHTIAALEHPNIIPIHDLGKLEDGRPFYAMRLATRRSLADVLAALEDGQGAEEWSVVRLVSVLQQVARALQHAHANGVLHRDVKPSNVVLGPTGEVMLVDWGIAKASGVRRPPTETHIIKASIHYMSPETARRAAVDERADVYSLGVCLFECLTLTVPFPHESAGEVIAAVMRDAAPDPRVVAGDRWVPAELATLTLGALEKDPEKRIPSAAAFHDGLQGFLEGLRDRERRRSEADSRCRVGEEALSRHGRATAEEHRLETEVARLEKELPPWLPLEEKRALLDARRRLESARDDAQALFLEAVNRYTDALAHDPDHPPARRALTDIFWRRFREAEHAGHASTARIFRSLVERFHDGRLTRELAGDGALQLVVTPDEAEVTLHPLVEQDLVLVDGPGQPLGTGRVEVDPLPMGSYVLVARAPGHEPARLPVCLERGQRWEGELTLPPEGTLPEGFVHVPAMTTWVGGDDAATNAWPLRKVSVASFGMKRHPVTFGEYCEFLDESDEPERWRPCLETTGPLCEPADDGRWQPVADRIWGAAEPSMRADGAAARVPVFCVKRDAADAWLAWASRRLGRTLRLPTSEEWEVAARGVDRRIYPWGNRYDAALCHCRDHFPWCDVAPVGSALTDRSVFGVHELGGSMQEWTGSPFAADPAVAEVRGGGWASGCANLRSAWRGACAVEAANVYLGFRAVLSLAEPAT